MKPKIKHIAKKATSNIVEIPSILNTLLKDETISGKLIITFAALAMLVVNSPIADVYQNFWHFNLSIGFKEAAISQDLRHWVNEGLMAIFFLVVGLEIKRELVEGELKDRKKAILPVAAAVGGMIVPAVIYLAFNLQSNAIQGWGIPIATDIAFAVAVLALLGSRVPLALKLFLLTLAIVDDIGAIFIIALFYAEIINYTFLFGAVGLLVAMYVFRKWLAGKLAIFIMLGVVLWVTTHLSGIHASIVGAALGLLAPLSSPVSRRSVSKRLEEMFLPVSTFIVLPVFAFANAGVVLTAAVFDGSDAGSIAAGIIAGLVLGKLVGITGASWLMVRLGLARLPSGTGWMHIVGVSLIAGIGFTVSIFIAELAFPNNKELVETAKVSIFIASGAAATLGVLILSKASKRGT